MPKHRIARAPLDARDEHRMRVLTRSTPAPADWIFHATMVALSWDGLRTRQVAAALGCHPETVRERLRAFNERGLDGLEMRRGSGHKPRLTEAERSAILALVKLPLPGKPTYELVGELAAPDPETEPEWTLDGLAATAREPASPRARERGIHVARSQVLHIFRRESVRWRRTRLCATSKDPEFTPQGPGSSRSTRRRPPRRPSSASTSSAPSPLTNFPPAPRWSPDGHRIKVPWTTSAGRTTSGSTGRCASGMGRL